MNINTDPAGAGLHWGTIKQVLWYPLLALLLLLGVGIAHFNAERRAEHAELLTSERLNVALGKTSIANALESVESDLAYLVAHNESRGLFRTNRSHPNTTLADDFVAFVEEKKVYDQVRFLDLHGMEQVRVNFKQGRAEIVPQQRLQNKSDRYYVAETLKVERNQTYVSPFDLNVEHAHTELPIKPVIRFGRPVFDSLGNKSGILVLNYLGASLLNGFKSATANIADHISLVNARGVWMSSPRPEDEWQLIREQATFAAEHGAAWQRLSETESGQLETELGLYTYTTIRPGVTLVKDNSFASASPPSSDLWKIIAYVPRATLLTTPYGFLARYLPLYLVMSLSLALGAFLLARATLRHRTAEAQIEFEQNFRKILESIQLKVVGVGRDAKVTFCNDALLELIGYESGDLLGRDWIDTLVAPGCRDNCRKMFSRLVAGEALNSRHESWVLTRDGKRRLMSWTDASVQGPAGPVAGVTFFGEDITESRRVEEELMKLSTAVEQSPSTVIITDTNGIIEYVNPTFSALTGYSLDEVRGMNPRLLKGGETTAVEYGDMWNTIATGGEWRGVFKNRKKNGEFYWETTSISAVRNLEGDITNYLAVKQDITEQRLLEQRFRLCVESAPNAMVLVNAQGAIVLVNRETEQMFGYSRDDLLGHPVEMLVPGAHRGAHASERAEFLSNPRSRAMGIGKELWGQRRDATLFPIDVGLHIVESDEGRMALAAIVDITESHRLEAELNERNQEIAKTEAVAAVGRMANMVAHDLRNPLSSIKMGLQIMGKQGAGRWSEEEAEIHGIALNQVRYMEEVLDDLLSYSKESSLVPEWLQIDKLLDAAILLVQKHIDEHDVKITTHYQAGLPTLHGDAGTLRRAFCNLLLNGIQATERIEDRRPELTISTHLELAPDRPKIRVSICDNGRGIDAEHATRAFDPFFTTRAMGTGLGLAIVKRIVEQHDGTVALLPGDITGTCATLVLPTDPKTEVRRPQLPHPADEVEESTEADSSEMLNAEAVQ